MFHKCYNASASYPSFPNIRATVLIKISDVTAFGSNSTGGSNENAS